MSSKHYIYPTTSDGRSKLVDREKVYEKDSDHSSTRYDSSDRSDTPPLSRASTPSSFSSPPTPTMSPAPPADAKTKGRRVEFASPVTHAYRRPAWDELSVMRAFASHTGHCDNCNRSVSDHHGGLCTRGLGLAKDLGTYFYSYDGKPHSTTDRKQGREKVQVEVPREYSSVKGLFEALDKGLKLKTSTPSKPDLHQSPYTPTTPRANSRRYSMDAYPTQNRRRYLDHEDYDLRPARSDSYRGREPVYQIAGGRYVDTRRSHHEDATDRRRPLSPSTPLAPKPSSSRYSSGIRESELRRLSEDLEKYKSRRLSDDKDRHYHDEYPSRYSDRSSRSSDMPSRSSERSSRSSDHYTHLPDRSSKSKDLPARSSDLPSRSSDRRSRLNDLSSWMKERPARSSELPLRSRDRPARLTDSPSRSTYRSSKPSELPSRLSDRSSRYSDRYTRTPRRRDSFNDRYPSRRDDGRRRRSTERHYHSDDDRRRSRRSSSYLPFSSLWR